MNRRILQQEHAPRLAVRRIYADSAASYVQLGRHTHRVELAGLQSTSRCATTTRPIGRASHSPQTRALSFDTPQLLSPLCLHRGMPGSTPTYTPIHSTGGGPHAAAWAYNTAAAAAAAAAAAMALR